MPDMSNARHWKRVEDINNISVGSTIDHENIEYRSDTGFMTHIYNVSAFIDQVNARTPALYSCEEVKGAWRGPNIFIPH